MRIGIDMLAVQSPGSRLRGVGRYGLNLVANILALDTKHEFILYAHEGFPSVHLPSSGLSQIQTVARDAGRGEVQIRQAMDRIAAENPDRLDALMVLNPFELCPGYDPPAKPLSGPLMVAVMHDLIPFLQPERYLSDPGNANWFHRRFRTTRTYDLLLSNSDATRDDCLAMMTLSPRRVVTISGAADADFFTPDRSTPLPFEVRRTLTALGIDRPFLLTVAGADDRKNVRGLIDAYRLLPIELQLSHQLVVTCHLEPKEEAKLRAYAGERGLQRELVLTGSVSDEILRTLYRRALVFCFPSLYEGLGLPLLEAMHCGTAVLGGNNSSQIEVVGDAGMLVNAADPVDISQQLERLLKNPELARELGERGYERAKLFSWKRSATVAIEAIESAGRTTLRTIRPERPRIAVFSPFTPKKSGISTYAARLVGELTKDYRVDLFHDEGYVPDLGLERDGYSSFDFRVFKRLAAIREYRGVLYQMGNSYYHGFLDQLMREHPGIVTLHDFSLAGYRLWYSQRESNPDAAFQQQILAAEPVRGAEILASLPTWKTERGGLQEALTRRGIHLNRWVFEAAERVIVHSPWCRDQASLQSGSFADKTVVVPLGARAIHLSSEERKERRRRFGLPENALIFASFGILSHGKMNVEAIRAFAVIAKEWPQSQFVFVGQDWEQGEARTESDSLGLGDRVRFLGHQSDEDFEALIGVADIGIALRRPPTYGETSAALLDLLRHGVPSIVNDVATFADYPDTAVKKIRWERDGLEGLIAAMRLLASDPSVRTDLGRAAMNHVEENHSWPEAARLYRRVIEDVHGQNVSKRSARRGVA